MIGSPDELEAPSRAVGWRHQRLQAQEQVLPSGSASVTCAAPLGGGGLSRHVEELVHALQRARREYTVVCSRLPEGDVNPNHHAVPVSRLTRPQRLSPLRFSSAGRVWSWSFAFDAYMSRRLPASDHLLAFNGQALSQLRTAARRRNTCSWLVSANSHIRRVSTLHARAHKAYPLERSWTSWLKRRNIAEYDAADQILVSSRYMQESFVEEGIPEARLSLFPLIPHPRYAPRGEPLESATFNVVYVGSLTVAKGVPLLVDAFRKLAPDDIHLTLVGGWASRGMRVFLERARAADRRITVAPGDPLPHLHKANVCVHASYEDGFGYAPAEALAAGVPVIATEDTGMKELIVPGQNGLILPTGDLSSLVEAMTQAYEGTLLDQGRHSGGAPGWPMAV